MLIIPAIDLRQGKVVNLRQGKVNEETAYSDNPIEIAGFKMPVPKSSANIMKIEIPAPITIPVKG